MKKFLSLLLIVVCLFNVVACVQDTSQNDIIPPNANDETNHTSTTSVCTHIWLDATCTTPKFCLLCAATEGEALGHNMLEATCTAPATCQNGCGLTESEALGHSGDFTVIGTPSEGNTWQKTRVCSICTETETVEIVSELSIPTEFTDPIYPTAMGTGGSTVKFVDGGKAQFTVVSAAPEYDTLAQSLSIALRTKLGPTFNYKASAQASTVTGKKIVVGKNPSTILPNSSDLSYLGLLCYYGGSSIHITGYNAETVAASIDRFLSMDFSPYISTGTDGKKLVSIPSNVFAFLVNPTNYIYSNPTLLGKPLSEYTIIVSDTMSATERFCVNQLIDEIGRYTGVYLSTKSESMATGSYEIVFGKSSFATSQALYANLGENEYAIKTENTCIYIASSHYSIDKATRNALHMLYFGNTAEAVNMKINPSVDPAKRIEKSDDTDVRVMSSNIVCPADKNGILEIATPYGITWQERIALVTREFMLYLPDFIGLQEIQNGTVNGIPADVFTEILNNVSDEYAFVVYDQMKDNPGAYWNPILYRKTVWQIEAQDVLYPDNFDNDMHRWQWVLFSKIEDPTQKYILLNLHNPTRTNLNYQLAAAETVNAKILELKELYPDIPIILTGDFNTEEGTETYNTTIANTDIRTTASLTDNINEAAKIDHVMASTDLLEVIAYRKINDDYMVMTSDHRPIFADLSLKKNLIPPIS